MVTFIQMATIPFDLLFQRPQQIMSILSEDNLVYYVEDKEGNYKIEQKPNLFIVGRDFDFNQAKFQGPVILWACGSSSDYVNNIKKIPHDLVIYDVIDDASEEFSYWAPYIDLMVSKADIIFTSADKLYDKFKDKHSRVYTIKNGVDMGNYTFEKNKYPNDMPKSKKKIVGYIGAVAPWIDWDLVNYIVTDNNYNYVFIGPPYGSFRPKIIRSNVYFLGNKDYWKLSYYLNNMDCCIIPFKVNNMTNSCNPIKMYEYLSLGKPIVTTNMNEAKKLKDLIYVSKNKKEFKNNIKIAIDQDNRNLFSQRIQIAKENTWRHRVDLVKQILKSEFSYLSEFLS